jgi:hypothetical protein
MTTFTQLFDKYEEEGYFYFDYHGYINQPMSKAEKKQWGESRVKWLITIEAENGEKHTIPHFHADGRNPNEQDILHDLFYHAHSQVCDMTFKEWCDNCGQDDDSIKALRLYGECKKLARAFKRLCTPEMYKEFMECENDY